jgi:hypothetical protein
MNKKMSEVLNLLICSEITSSVSFSASKNLMEKQCKKKTTIEKISEVLNLLISSKFGLDIGCFLCHNIR